MYTPEVFPTKVRGVAMGFNTAAARIGAIITPFVAQVSSSEFSNQPFLLKSLCISSHIVSSLLSLSLSLSLSSFIGIVSKK